MIEFILKSNNKLCKLFKNDIFLFSFVILFISCLLIILPRTYGINDNVGILWDVEQGFISDFTSFFDIKLLHILYQTTSNIPWYGLILYFVHILSLFIFIKSLVKINKIEVILIPFLIAYLYFYSFFITQVDYTSASIMIGANSLFAFLIFLNNKKVHTVHVLGLGILFSLSFFIRVPGTFAVLAYGFPIIIFFIYKHKTHFVIFFIPFLLLFVGEHIARTYFIPDAHQQYHEFNILRGKLHGFPILKANQNNDKILKANNWTKDDYKNFQNWNFFDERKYNIDTLSNIFKYSVLKEENKIQKYITSYFQKLSKLLTYNKNQQHIYFLLLISILIIFKFHWFLVLIIFGYISYIFSLSIYMDIFYRFPARIAHPILLMCTSFIILLKFNVFSNKFPPRNRNMAIFAIGIFLFLFNIVIHHNIPQKDYFNSSINKLQSLYKGKILYIPPLVFKWEDMDPLKRYYFNFHMIHFGGTNTFSPSFYKSLEKMEVKKGYEMMFALINNPDAYIIINKKNSKLIKFILNYIMENYNIKCKAYVVDKLSNGKLILKLKNIHY